MTRKRKNAKEHFMKATKTALCVNSYTGNALSRVAEVVRRHEGGSAKSLDSYEKFKP